MLILPDFTISTAGTVSAKTSSFDYGVLKVDFKTELEISTVYKEHVQFLYDYGMHMCGIHGIVVDCLQDLFSSLRRNPGCISGSQPVKPYLFRSFRRSLIQRIIRNQKLVGLLPEHEAFKLITFVSAPNEHKMGLDQATRLHKGFQSFTKDQREVIYLKFCQGLTYGEIAEITLLQMDTVYHLVSTALELLGRKVQPQKHPVTIL